MCLAKMAPACLEYQTKAFIGKWDFSSPDYSGTIFDQGNNNLDFQLLNNQDLYDPIYVHNQGLFFDGTSSIRTTNYWNPQGAGNDLTQSFTYEAWIRPSDAVQGDLIAFEEFPGLTSASIGFNGNTIEVDVGGTIGTIPITAPTVDEWTYVGVSVQKIENNRMSI